MDLPTNIDRIDSNDIQQFNEPSPALYWTAVQTDILTIAGTVSASLAVFGSMAVILTFMFWRRFQTPANRLIFFMAVSDLMSAVAILLGRLTATGSFSTLCVFQAFLLQWGDLASVAWTAAMSWNLILVLFLTRSARDLDHLEKYYFFICYGMPFLMAFVPLFIYTPVRGLVYGQDALRCWIAGTWPELRLALFYIPIWTFFLFNLTVYTISGLKIISKTRNMPPIHNTNNALNPRAPTTNPNSSQRQFLTTTTATRAHMDSIATDPDQPRHASFLSIDSQPPLTHDHHDPEGGGPRRDTQYSVTSHDDTATLHTVHSISSYPTTTNQHTSRWSRLLKQATSSTNTPQMMGQFRRRYFQKITLFLLAYVLTWTMPSVIRIWTWSTVEPVPFLVYAMQQVTTPARGFINFLCYFLLTCLSTLHQHTRQKQAQKWQQQE